MPDDKPLLLLVDDDPLISDALSYALSADFDVVTSHNRNHCLQLVRQLRQTPELAVVDLGLPPLPHRPDEGFALIGDLLAHSPAMKIFVLSGQNDDENARHARTLGAFEFIGKPCDPAGLIALLRQARAFTAPGDQAGPTSPGLIGDSAALERLRLQLTQYADSAFPVLIEGESGSGKDIVASVCLHRQTQRGSAPFLALNCAAIAPSLLEPTLFGHAKGAFTGAVGTRPGYFEEAGNGTLFLDEIGELPLDLQPKLLRVLENGEYQRVGETQTRISRARILAATNRDLKKEVRAGRFRADLFHRLSVFTVTVPALRDMDDDRLRLLDHFRELYARQAGTPPFALDTEATALWRRYSFPGNVRELRNIVIRLTARYGGQTVSAGQLRDELDDADSPETAPAAMPIDPESIRKTARQTLEQMGSIHLDNTLSQWEQAYIDAALHLSRGNVSEAARRLGLNRTTLYSRMEGRLRQ